MIPGNRILVVGRAGMDLYADPSGTRVEEAESFKAALGGSAANIAVAAARLGGRVSLFSAVSDDAVGRFVIRQLQSYGIGTRFVSAVGGQHRNSLAVVETRAVNCQNILYRNSAADFELSASMAEVIPWKDFDCVIVTGTGLAMEPSRSVTMAIVKAAQAAGVTTVIDVDYRPYSWKNSGEAAQICKTAIDFCDIVIGNDEEFAVLAETGDGRALAKACAVKQGKLVVYKMGSLGSVTFAANEEFTTGIYAVKALKPTGAGDAFMGAFIMGLINGTTIPEAVKRGSANAALVVTRVGCAPAMPDQTDLNRFMAQHTGPA